MNVPHCRADPAFVGFPPAAAARYRALGLWTGAGLWDLLAYGAAHYPARIAVVDPYQRLDYGTLATRALALARQLHGAGLQPGDAVLVQLPNSATLLTVYFALYRLGVRPIATQLPHRMFELGHFAQKAKVTAHLVSEVPKDPEDYRALARELGERYPEVRHRWVLPLAGAPLAQTLDGGPVPQLGGEVALPPPPDSSDIALFQLSGGTTALPKFIARTHDDYLYSIRQSVERCGFDGRTVYMAALPVPHNYPLSSPGVLGALLAGGRVVMVERPIPAGLVATIKREQVNVTAVVPALVPPLLKAAQRAPGSTDSLRLLQVGGAKLHEGLAQQIPATLGCQLQQVFGMAEGLVCYTGLTEPSEQVARYQGRPMSPYDEVRVVDDQDQPVPPGTVGHLLARGPYTICGYYNAPEHNRCAFSSDGFYRTGDLVAQLPDGGLVVLGRHKDQINRAGEKIAAPEVEAVLCTHPAVDDVALVGVPDPYLGERSYAFVLAREQVAPGRLLNHLRAAGLAGYKLPDRICVVSSLPKTPIGKVDKKQLRQQAQQANDGPSTSGGHMENQT